MTPRKKLHAKPGKSVGIEFDHLAIRAARLDSDGNGRWRVDALSDVTGNFAEDAELVDGLRLIKDRLRIGPKDSLATCLSGKQVSASQVAFRKLPPDEMSHALRLEMRKSVPFEITGSSLDYQILGDVTSPTGTVQVLVALAGAGLLSRHLKIMGTAGLSPLVVDVLPISAGNALWNWVGMSKSDAPIAAVHIGPQISTIVIDGPRSPFFHRYVYFAAEDFLGRDGGAVELEKRTSSLAEEVARSLAFYEKSASAGGFQEICLLGEYLETPLLADKLRRQTGLDLRRMDLPRKLGHEHDMPAGRFDLAVSLALRAGED